MNNLGKVIMVSMLGTIAFGGVALAIYQSQPSSSLATQPHSNFRKLASNNTVPNSVTSLGEYGENIYDFAQANDWTKAKASLKSLKDVVKSLPTNTPNKSLVQLNSDLVSLTKAINNQNQQSAVINANQVTFIADEITMQYQPKVPVEVNLLDYYGRELQIWSAAGNTTKLTTTVNQMRRTWIKLKPSVITHGGSVEAQKFNTLIANAETAKSPTDYKHIATPILDEVDNLEKVFK